LFVIAVVLTVPVYAFAVRRLLGLRLSPMRALIGGIVALACASPIITAIGSSIVKHNGSWSVVAAGLTNEAIAERLYLSVRTVEHHLSSVYSKLSLSGKAARAAAAVSFIELRTSPGRHML
jgi:hypothetical protein